MKFLRCQVFEDVVGVDPGEPVESRDDQDVAGANGGQCHAQAGPAGGGSGQPVVGIDPVAGDAECSELILWAVRSCSSVETRA